MRSAHRSLILALLIAAALAGAYFVFSRSKNRAITLVHPSVSKTAPAVVVDKPPSTDQPSAEPPVTRLGELSAAPQVPKALKDANGNSILETVMTPDGPVTIHRTFAATGEVVRERAFLNGKEVSVPSQTRR